MDETEYDSLTSQVETAKTRLTDYETLKTEIDRHKAMVGNVYQVAWIDQDGTIIKTSDAALIAKAETALSNQIAAMETELSNI